MTLVNLNESINKFLGIPYVYGGNSSKGMDCSAFTSSVYKDLGYNIGRTSIQQYTNTKRINLDDVQVGDLMFLKGTQSGRKANQPSHVEIVVDITNLSEGKLKTAGTAKRGTVSATNRNIDLNSNYYKKALLGFGRVSDSNKIKLAKYGMRFEEKQPKVEMTIVKEQPKADPVQCLLCAILNSLGLSKEEFSNTPDPTPLLGGNIEIVIEMGGPKKAYSDDSLEEMFSKIFPMIDIQEEYTEEDIKKIREDKKDHGEAIKKLLGLMDNKKIAKAFNGMQLLKKSNKSDLSELSTVQVEIGDEEYTLFEAKTEKQKASGLMGVKELKDNEGMIFYYDKPQDVSFWMKDTIIPLTICFFNEDFECISVKQGHPLSEKAITEKNVMFVVELNANADVTPGDEIDFPGDDDDYVMQVLGPNGEVQYQLKGGERIVSRRETLILIKKAKRAYSAKNDPSYEAKCKSLGKYIFKVLDGQDNRDPEYVSLT